MPWTSASETLSLGIDHRVAVLLETTGFRSSFSRFSINVIVGRLVQLMKMPEAPL